MRVLVLGANGMIGNAMLRVLSENEGWAVIGVVRDKSYKQYFPKQIASRIITGVDLVGSNALLDLFAATKPDVVVNCAGLTKHVPQGKDLYSLIEMNAQLPNRLMKLCSLLGARLIQVSTDCVFSGSKGKYRETDVADAQDSYGRSKVLGEVNGPGCVTLRTSTIGHEINTKYGLLEWFLSQERCKGFERAIFSGMPSNIFAQVVRDVVVPDTSLNGLYHVAGPSISKLELLKIIADIYQVPIEIIPDEEFVIDRSLDASCFFEETGYSSPSWSEMVSAMYEYYKKELSSYV
jgi:dTDP-4-dehydrorhamnose reductase